MSQTAATLTDVASHLMQLRGGEPEADVLRGLVAHETQITRLKLGSSSLPPQYRSVARQQLRYEQLGTLTALRHLDAMELPAPKPSDWRALQRLHQLTTLALPLRVCLCIPRMF